MCIIVSKEKGVKLPNRDVLETCWNNNSDGAGISYVKDGSVYIKKGFMTFTAFSDALDRICAEIDVESTPMVLHFRITTHGGTKPENCHPFPISENAGLLRKIECRSDVAVAHNGIIYGMGDKNLSDTMEYIVTQMSYFHMSDRRFYDNKHLMKAIENAIGASKMAFLAKDGNIRYIGNFVTVDGVKYSNDSYMPRLSISKSYINTYGGNWYNWWNDDRYSNYDDGWEEYVPNKKKKEKTAYDVYVTVKWIDPGVAYLLTDDGVYESYGAFIDKQNNVYIHNFETDTAEEVVHGRAYKHNGGIFTYNECKEKTETVRVRRHI